MFAELLKSSYFALFVIVALGFMLGRIRIKGLSLDISAVIFVALLFGHYGVLIPKELGDLGLVLFIFTIGIQAGPGFFDSFRSKGKTLILITVLIILSASLTAVGLKYLFGLDTPSTVGLIAGALTSTPGLAVAIDSTNSPLASIAYGIAYPFGVIGVILFVKLLPRLLKVNLEEEARQLEAERIGQFPQLKTCVFHVTNSSAFGKSLAQLNIRAVTGAVVSRIKSGEQILMPSASYALQQNDYIQAVGSEESLAMLAEMMGERQEGELPLTKRQIVETILLRDRRCEGSFRTVGKQRKITVRYRLLPDCSGHRTRCVGRQAECHLPGRRFLLTGTDRRRVAHLSGTECHRQDRTDSLEHVRSGQPVVAPVRSVALPRRSRNFCRSETGSHIPGKRLEHVRGGYVHHPGSDDHCHPCGPSGIQDFHARPFGYPHRRYDQYSGSGSGRLYGGQQYPGSGLCHSLPDCHGLPDPVHSVDFGICGIISS